MSDAPSVPFPCVVLGGGGHARVVVDALRCSGAATPCAVLDRDPSRCGADVHGVPVLGNDEQLPVLLARGVKIFVMGLGGAGDNMPRRLLFERAMEAGLTPLTVVHPRAVVSPWAAIGAGTLVAPGAVVNAGAVLGVNVIVNTGAIVEHDCLIGDHAHVATGACLAGGVRVGAGAHVGAGAVVRQGVRIGDGAIVGAGAVVVDDVPPGIVVAGVPARPLAPPKT